MEAYLPPAFHADLDNAAARLVVQALIDHDRPSLSHLSTANPVTPRALASYGAKIKRFASWAERSEADLIALANDDRLSLIEEYLAAESNRLTTASLDHHRSALKWWAHKNALPYPLSDIAKHIKGVARGRGKANGLDQDDLTALIAGLKQCVVTTGDAHDDRYTGWHLRTRAAVLITVTCSLRSAAELPQMTDDTILRVDDDGIVVRLPLTKNRRHRDIAIRPRSDELCPLTALTDWFAWLDQHGLERPGGLLLPQLHLNRRMTSPDFLYGGPASPLTNTEWGWWKMCRTYLADLGHDMTGKSPHGLRSMAITEAVASGWSHTQLRDLGGWDSLSAAVGYVRISDPRIDLYKGDS